MPKLIPIEVTTPAGTTEFAPFDNGPTTVWINGADVLNGGSTVTYTRRPSNSQQTTRKASMHHTVPLIAECENTCSVTSRGAILFKLDNVVSTESTIAERTAAYETFVALMQDASIKDAFINNGTFYS